MQRPVTPKDLIAPLLLWGLVLVGLAVGDVKPPHRAVAVACLR